MTFDARENSRNDGEPYELYLFETETKSWRVTSADREISYLAHTYERAAIHRTGTEQGQELKSGSIQITIPKTHPLAGEFIGFIPSTPMSLVIYRGHEGEAEVAVQFVGGISRAQFTDECELTAIPESDILKSTIPITQYQRPCNHFLYDVGCQMDRDDFKTTAVLSLVNGTTVKSAAFAAQADGWFDAGYIERGTERRMILTHVGDTLTLLNAMSGLAGGATIDAFAGCMRNSQVCRDKFDNLVHFLGFEFIPTKNPFVGGVQ